MTANVPVSFQKKVPIEFAKTEKNAQCIKERQESKTKMAEPETKEQKSPMKEQCPTCQQ